MTVRDVCLRNVAIAADTLAATRSLWHSTILSGLGTKSERQHPAQLLCSAVQQRGGGKESSVDSSHLGIVPRDKRPALLGASQSRLGLGVGPWRHPPSSALFWRAAKKWAKNGKMSSELAGTLNAGRLLGRG